MPEVGFTIWHALYRVEKYPQVRGCITVKFRFTSPAVRVRGPSLLLGVTDAVTAADDSATYPVHFPQTYRCSDPRYQGLTYLGADNAISVPDVPPGSTTAFNFLATAAEAACTPPPPDPVPQTLTNEAPGSEDRDSAGAGIAPAVDGDVVVRSLEELDDRAADEACTPAGAAQALARIACRLYDLADDLGGG